MTARKHVTSAWSKLYIIALNIEYYMQNRQRLQGFTLMIKLVFIFVMHQWFFLRKQDYAALEL